MTVTTPNVATPSAAQAAIADAAALPRALMGGTKAMRAAGEKYLPKEPAETVEAYANRLKRTTLFNGFGKTVSDMTGKVFAKPIVLKDNVPEQIRTMAENVDLTGRHINVFARDVFYDALQPGVSYILVDMPPAEGKTRTVAQERAEGRRPYLVHIPVERLIGWKSDTVNGAETLTQVRILECVYEPDGPFHEKEIEQVRVLEPGTWATWRRGKEADEWVPYANGMNSLKKIAIVPVYTNRTGFMTGSPPLNDLADTNVAHWQSQSDQRNILHVARVPILFGAGIAEDSQFVIGANAMIRTSNPDAKLEFVEHTGNAIDSGDKDLKNLEFQMQTLGLQLLVPTPGGKTATGEARDDSKENSPLAMMARSLGDAIEEAFGLMGEYIGLGPDQGGEVDVNKDFGILAGALTDIPNILSAKAAGVIDQETALAELKRRGFLSDSVDAAVVMSKTEAAAEAEIERMQKAAPMDLGAT